MIKLYYPQGCYGTYLSRSIYNYTNLRQGPLVDFTFDEHGGSHLHKENAHSGFFNLNLLRIHLIDSDRWSPSYTINQTDQVVVIYPLETHALDYYNNQFAKRHNLNITSYIQYMIDSQFSIETFKEKLWNNWGIKYDHETDIPRWVFREFISFWIKEFLKDSFSDELYKKLDATVAITTEDIFKDFDTTIQKVCSALGLNIIVEQQLINKNHKIFLNLQTYHLSQDRCDQWVNDIVLSDIDSVSPCQTIIDEAYVQCLLRNRGYELHCYNLESFPKTADQIRKIMYERMQNNNQG